MAKWQMTHQRNMTRLYLTSSMTRKKGGDKPSTDWEMGDQLSLDEHMRGSRSWRLVEALWLVESAAKHRFRVDLHRLPCTFLCFVV
jgi:hypothetical protein